MPEEILQYQAPLDYSVLLGDMNLQKLHRIFKETVKRKEDKVDPIRSRFGKIEKDEINLDIKTAYIENYVAKKKRLGFRELLEKQNSKMEVIVTFLVILELMKIGVVQIEQNDIFDDIIIIYMGKQAESVAGFLN